MDAPIPIRFDIPGPFFWGTVALMGLIVTSYLIYLTIPDAKGESGPLRRLGVRLGMPRLNPVLLLVGSAFFFILVSVLLVGLLGMIIGVVTFSGAENAYARIGGLTAVLGGILALPFTLIRLTLAQESLFNDKINEATKGLYARRQVTVGDASDAKDQWQDDIVQRNAAIDRLEGLALEKPAEIPRITRLLCVYVRELSQDHPPIERPEDQPVTAWAHSLAPVRSDMEKATQAIGRLNPVDRDNLGNEIDLRGANLQGSDLQSLNFDRARLNSAHLEGANLQNTSLQQSDLSNAALLDANLRYADLSFAFLRRASLNWADLTMARLRNANCDHADFSNSFLHGADFDHATMTLTKLDDAFLIDTRLGSFALDATSMRAAMIWNVQLDDNTGLDGADLTGASLRNVTLTTENLGHISLDKVFGDGSVVLPPDYSNPKARFDDWPDAILQDKEYMEAWGDWRSEHGL